MMTIASNNLHIADHRYKVQPSQSTVSAHLATLQRAGLISSKKVGQRHFLKRNEDAIQAPLKHISQALQHVWRDPNTKETY